MVTEKNISEAVLIEGGKPKNIRVRIEKVKRSDTEWISIFWSSSMDALFNQEAIAPIINKSVKTLEADRWRGQGIPYRKCGGRVLYRKSDVINWIENHKLVTSTSEYTQEVNHA